MMDFDNGVSVESLNGDAGGLRLSGSLRAGRPASEHVVRRVVTKGDQKKIVIETLATQVDFSVHRHGLVGPRDRIRVRDGLERRIWVVDADGGGDIPVSPPFEEHRTIIFAGDETQTRIVEPTSAADHSDHAELEAFHYRGLDFSDPERATKKGVGGRRAVLLAQVRTEGHWVTAGYIELQMPLLMAKPRHVAFNRPFRHPSGLSWEDWRKGGQEHVNRIVRIARTVVHPEYRGAKLSAQLVQAAMRFARERWHIAGKRPLFLEISAEMLRHIDFVSGCGFHYLGDTEGNRGRVAKDLESMRQGAKGESGIMSVQRRYYAAFEEYRLLTGDTFEALQARIAELLTLHDPFSAMTREEWLALRPIIRSPIPYYMVGLDEAADNFVREAALERRRPPAPVRDKRPSQLELSRVELWSNYEIPETAPNRLVMSSFGISTPRLVQRLTGSVSLTAAAGTITFVAGASGCGKSLFLANLDPAWQEETINVRGEVQAQCYRAGWLRPLPPKASLFGHLADQHGAERAFDALARVGLSEALLFLKPFDMLSRGQRYRAMLADLLLRDDDVWLIDEFCSDLDPLSARIVASRLRETVRAEGRIAFVAAANHRHFIHALRPTRVVMLRTGREATVGTWREYADGLLH
jgi:energy-coupling factor transporter ATP-binding protein EcfA2/GNAT superfamily N-acetyltransferase